MGVEPAPKTELLRRIGAYWLLAVAAARARVYIAHDENETYKMCNIQ